MHTAGRERFLHLDILQKLPLKMLCNLKLPLCKQPLARLTMIDHDAIESKWFKTNPLLAVIASAILALWYDCNS